MNYGVVSSHYDERGVFFLFLTQDVRFKQAETSTHEAVRAAYAAAAKAQAYAEEEANEADVRRYR